MISFKDYLAEAKTTVVGDWKFVYSAHVFDRFSQRTNFGDEERDQIITNISKKLVGLRFAEYGFHSKKFNKIMICEVDPQKKVVKLITVLDGNMKLKHGTSKIITESLEIIEI